MLKVPPALRFLPTPGVYINRGNTLPKPRGKSTGPAGGGGGAIMQHKLLNAIFCKSNKVIP